MLGRETVIIDTNIRHNDQAVLSDKSLEIIQAKQLQFSWHVIDTDENNNANKPTLVLIHGNSSSTKIWKETIPHFETSYRVVAVDLLGHGQSTKIMNLGDLAEEEKDILAADLYSPLALTKQLEQIFHKKSIIGAHVIGWSLGGHLAYALSAIKPNTIAKLISIGSPPVRFSEEGFKEGFHAWFAVDLIQEWIHKPQVFSLETAKKIAGSMHAENDSDLIQDLMETDPLVRKYLFANFNRYESDLYNALDAKKYITTTNIALLLMVGENDKGINPQYILTFAKLLQNPTSSVCMEKAEGHLLCKSKSFFDSANKFFTAASNIPICVTDETFENNLVIINTHGSIRLNNVSVTKGGIFASSRNSLVSGGKVNGTMNVRSINPDMSEAERKKYDLIMNMFRKK